MNQCRNHNPGFHRCGSRGFILHVTGR